MKKLLYIICLFSLLFLIGCTKNYTLTYNTNGADAMDSITVKAKETVTLANPTNRTGYTFGGWYLEENFITKVTEITVTKDVTVYAKWDILKFKVKFMDHDGKQIGNDVTVEYGKSATAPTNPTREGYTFKGWDKTFNNVTSDLVVTAQYEVNKYTVKFVDYDDSQIGSTQTVEYGKAATAPANPTRDGYTFDKWDKAYDSIKSNLVVKAVYIPIQYTIKYYDGNTLIDDITVNTYTIETELTLPTYNKDGFIFVNWYKDNEFTEVITKINKGTKGEIIVYGKWLDQSQKLTIQYELNGGSWTWTVGTVDNSGKGIDSVSNLPEIFMIDFYTYLKDNNLLNSSKVHSSLRKTTWEDFKKNYTDPVAIYNHTSSNKSSTTDGYSQFFYSSATGDSTTRKITSITGGFFGTEPYKTKYAGIAQLLAYMIPERYSSSVFWGGEESKALAGFILDGFFYGTQGIGSGKFAELRKVIPNTNAHYEYINNVLTKVDVTYPVTEYIKGLSFTLQVPVREGYVFAGWYDNASFTGNPITEIVANATPATKYYAKWVLPA